MTSVAGEPIPDGRHLLAGREVWVREHGGIGPAVLFVNGCAISSALWQPVVRRLGTTRRITFDRPGLGGTRWPGQLPTLNQEVATLTQLIERVGAPVLLVAHSMAAFHAEALLRLRPDLVTAAVMVDGSVEWPNRPPRQSSLWPARQAHRITASVPLHHLGGLVHRIGVGLQSEVSLPWKVSRRFHQLYADPDAIAMGLAEFAAYPQQAWDLLEVRAGHPMPSLPIEVLSATDLAPRHWQQIQRRWARLLGSGGGAVHQLDVVDSRHLMMLDRPDAVAAAINRLA